ncbi:MAG TPA: FAD-dependent oxidoreductase [Usitatibacteraceae bacterium]
MKKRLLLLGGGHAHLHVLKSLGDAPIENVEITLLSPWPHQVYSGMLPGWVAGHYRIEQCVIPLAPLARRAGAIFCEGRAIALDLSHNTVSCDNGNVLSFDALSIDTGSAADLSAIPGAGEHAVSVRPIETFIETVARIKAAVHYGSAADQDRAMKRFVFVGAGAGGIELALGLQHAFPREQVEISLVSAANTLPGTVGKRLLPILAERGIKLIAGQAATRIEAQAVHLASGEKLDVDVIITATGASAADWPRAAGLACDERGFILVNDHLQSTSHPQVFAAGDCATMEHFSRPKSGVYAVRGGPPLAGNLRRFIAQQPLKAFRPQARSLYLLSTGDRYAIASWGSLTWEGAWVWKWKDWIDRGFVGKYTAV